VVSQSAARANRLKAPVDGQFADADCAMCGCGDFSLQLQWMNHRLTVDVWSKMMPTKREKASKKCFYLPGLPTSTSSDGQLKTPGGGKKLHQKTGSHAHRITTTGPTGKKIKNESDDKVLT